VRRFPLRGAGSPLPFWIVANEAFTP
jgi:hypothetical protein